MTATLFRGCDRRDAFWLRWPLLGAANGGKIVAGFPLRNLSFNRCCSGRDL
jgi:hypothetical protein